MWRIHVDVIKVFKQSIVQELLKHDACLKASDAKFHLVEVEVEVRSSWNSRVSAMNWFDKVVIQTICNFVLCTKCSPIHWNRFVVVYIRDTGDTGGYRGIQGIQGDTGGYSVCRVYRGIKGIQGIQGKQVIMEIQGIHDIQGLQKDTGDTGGKGGYRDAEFIMDLILRFHTGIQRNA